MVKRIGRRFVSLLLTIVTVLTLLPAMTLPALAATSGPVSGLTDETIGLSFEGEADNAWSASGSQIIGAAIGTGGACGDTHYKSTLTITNKKPTKATLSFDYAIVANNGTIEVDSAPVTSDGKFSKELASNESITVYIKSGSTSAATRITMTNVTLVYNVTATVTFRPAENGSYTVDRKKITEAYTNTQSSATAYQVEATPAKGYQFMGWYNETEGKYIHTSPKAALNIENDCIITARFASATAALFETVGQVFDDLTDAINYAQQNHQSKITLFATGSISGQYVIPVGIILSIPFDAAGTMYTDKPSYVGTYEGQKVFRKLTMVPGSSITVYGAISVGGKHTYNMGLQGPSGPYGQIDMVAGSFITLKDGANLYAWGYITGDGQITANSGATVYEYFQLRDWRGGNATTSMTGIANKKTRVFPFSQYYVQNIEAPLTLQDGATEQTYFTVSAGGKTVSTKIEFIGNSGLFKLNPGGSISKKYVPATGRTEYTTNGGALLDKLTVSAEGLSIESNKYVLPINGNMTLNIASGKVTSNYDICLLPGVQINIANGAEMTVAPKASLYAYDSDQWGNYCCGNVKIKDVNYSPTPGRHTRTEDDLVDATIDVNGTLTAAGSVYTTESGANICSSEGSGRFVQQGTPGTATVTYQATQEGNKITGYPQIPITAAKLKNADGVEPSYTQTKDAKADDIFTYCKCQDCGGGKWTNTNDLQVAEIDENDGTLVKTYNTLKGAVDNLKAGQYIKLLHNTTEDINNITKDIYLDLNGRTVTGDISVTNGYKLSGMDSSTGTGYDTAPSGKIVGKVTGTVAPVFEKPLTGDAEYNYLRYVAIKNEEGTEYTFHRFNISVTGYRFELAAPQCALFFIGKFRGDDAAKKYLTKLGFTLKYIADESQDFSYPMPGSLNNEVGLDEEGAYLFEAYLMRSFDKNDAAAYQTKISATAQAIFGTNVGTQNSETKEWSFQEAWQHALTDSDMDISPAEKEILEKFLKDLNIPIPNPNPKTE